MSNATIPFNVPYLSNRSSAHVAAAMRGGKFSGDGPYTALATDALVRNFGYDDALLTTSCTHALEIASLLLDLGPGDEVIVPSFTFVSTASAVAVRGAVPVFADIRPDTLSLDITAVEAAITPRTKAVAIVHYAGIASGLEELVALCDRHGLVLIEDNAHGLGGTYRGQALGTFGALSTLSFHETKNLQCGEGGALVFNGPRFKEAAEIIREKGTNRSAFFRGQVDKYTWVSLGSSYLPSDILTALLLGGIEDFSVSQAARVQAWDSYESGLASWAAEFGVSLPTVPAQSTHPAHLFYMLLPDPADQSALIDHLAGAGIHATTHYVPLHSSPGGLAHGRAADPCRVTSSVSERLIRLPMHAQLGEAEIDRVLSAVTAFRPREGTERIVNIADSARRPLVRPPASA